ncbi:T9SS type A sorting domain-containing protein [Winogradskyella eckloniae]|uniref:YCF48-related protein n=1 Tax=Winogradskyella eckloniae TaxID=1089306 RepID=UPI001565AE77|nr:YCF48-related protein [Winogradskyella eckloniae]NRD21097.1 T9SS type A sorting domain-containing protein [Winogradskyella eckloniae]
MKTCKLLLLLFGMTISAQSSWQPVPNIVPNLNGQRFDDVYFLNNSTGWAANGYYAAVYKTTDGGLTWTEQLNENNLSGSYYFRNIEFLNESIGFIGTLNGTVFKTIDGGINWTEIENISPNPNAICGLSTIGTSTIYGCGAYFSPAHIIKSTDSGDTWTFIDMSSYADALVEILFTDENTGYVAGKNEDGALILKTTDGGLTWTALYNSNIPGEYIWKIQTLEQNPDFIVGALQSVAPYNGKLIKSTDGGTNWLEFEATETDIQAVGFLSETHGWLGGHTTGFYETQDGGETWTNLNVGNNLNRIYIIDESTAFAAGTTIYKYTSESLTTSDLELDTTSQHIQIKNLKNPVEDHIEITIDFKSDDNILIELYDINGKFISQLARDVIDHATEKNYSFNISELAVGAYFINFHNNSGRSAVKIIKI